MGGPGSPAGVRRRGLAEGVTRSCGAGLKPGPDERSWECRQQRDEAPGPHPAVLQQAEVGENRGAGEGAVREEGGKPSMSGRVWKRECLKKGHEPLCEML